MPFPHHDRYWTEVTGFVRDRIRAGESLLAPDVFWAVFEDIHRYLNTFRDPGSDYDFAIIHKGEIACLQPAALDRIVDQGRCVFANPVFVVWSTRHDLPPVDPDSDHVKAFYANRSMLTPEEIERGRAKVVGDDTVLADPGRITRFESLDRMAFTKAMNRFWENGGYRYRTRRDQVYFAELDRLIADFSNGWRARRVLDLACGVGRLPESLIARNAVTGVDIAEVAVARARRRAPGAVYAVMDACRIGFADASFDAVLFIDTIEHVADAQATLSEIARILVPGGELIATVANRNSLHEVIGRKLGFPEFKTNYQHIREFGYDETRALLIERGFVIEDARGIFLYPFWGIPLLDSSVRHLTDEDPEMVELLRLLGERIGPEYAYSFAVRAIKRQGASPA